MAAAQTAAGPHAFRRPPGLSAHQDFQATCGASAPRQHGRTALAGKLGLQHSSRCRFPSQEGEAYESERTTAASFSYRADWTPERSTFQSEASERSSFESAAWGTAPRAEEPPCMQDMYQVMVDQPDFASTDNVESLRFCRAPRKASPACMAILNIPYTYPTSWLHMDIDQLGLPHTGLYYPRDRKSKDRYRGFAFVNFSTPEDAQAFQQLFHHRVLSCPGVVPKSVTVWPSDSSTGVGAYSGANSETQRWPPQRLAAPPGIHQWWQASTHRSSSVAVPRARPVPPPMFEDGAVVLGRFFV